MSQFGSPANLGTCDAIPYPESFKRSSTGSCRPTRRISTIRAVWPYLLPVRRGTRLGLPYLLPAPPGPGPLAISPPNPLPTAGSPPSPRPASAGRTRCPSTNPIPAPGSAPPAAPAPPAARTSPGPAGTLAVPARCTPPPDRTRNTPAPPDTRTSPAWRGPAARSTATAPPARSPGPFPPPRPLHPERHQDVGRNRRRKVLWLVVDEDVGADVRVGALAEVRAEEVPGIEKSPGLDVVLGHGHPVRAGVLHGRQVGFEGLDRLLDDLRLGHGSHPGRLRPHRSVPRLPPGRPARCASGATAAN